MKRIQRKQLKEDELVSTVNKIVNYAKARTKELAAIGAALLVLLLVFIGVRTLKSVNLKKENQKLSKILRLEEELKTDPAKLDLLAEMAGKGKYARLANLKLATYWYGNNDFDRCLEFLGKIPDSPKDLIYYQSLDLKAQVKMSQTNYDEAIAIYARMDEENPKEYMKDVVLFNLAQAYENKGDLDKALELYKKLQEDFSQTYYGFDATQKVKEIEEKK